MAETAKIAEIATKASNEIFSVFGWERRPPRDRNWQCVTEKHKKETHPSDVVFSYADPVEHSTIFFTTDLKSYSKATITQEKTKYALRSLSMSAECAGKSASWRDLYVNVNQNYKVRGLLFIYNHDGEFDVDFGGWIKDATSSSMRLRRPVRLHVLGPREIRYLFTIANDIKCERGSDCNLPDPEDCWFFYPDLVRIRVKDNYCKAATIEVLTGPWQVLRYRNAGKDRNRKGYHFYYSGDGSAPEEFKHIFDFLFRHQLVGTDENISIRLAQGCKEAGLNFERAKEQYVHDFFPYVNRADLTQRLGTISFFRVTTVVQKFSDQDLGLEE
jgi:hypothetical protein